MLSRALLPTLYAGPMTLIVPAPRVPSSAVALCLNCPAGAGTLAPHRHCDQCGVGEAKGLPILRFSLVRSIVKDGRHSSRGVGTLLMCKRCYDTTAGRRRRQFGSLADALAES